MKANPQHESQEIDFSKFTRQGLYSDSVSQADGFSESESGDIEPVIFQAQSLRDWKSENGIDELLNHVPSESLVEPEPMPMTSDSPAMWDLVVQSLQEVIKVARERDQFGLNKYGTRLQAFNGRRPLVDAFQESLDQTVYLQQEIYEREFIDKVVEAAVQLVELFEQDQYLPNEAIALYDAVSALRKVRNNGR